MANDQLGKRMKNQYESRTRTYLPRRTYTIIRLDGKAFHTFTKGMERPYDKNFIQAMNETALYLCKNIQGCKMGYVQSDEISLLLTDFETITTDAWFDGNIQKICSVSASMATAEFNWQIQQLSEEGLINVNWNAEHAFFDARVFTIPDPTEVENYFIWRQLDAVRNSISMHAQSLYSHKELNGKSQIIMLDMIHEKGQNWNDLPEGFKRGRTVIYYPTNIEETVNAPTGWTIITPDFLKERELFKTIIPLYT